MGAPTHPPAFGETYESDDGGTQRIFPQAKELQRCPQNTKTQGRGVDQIPHLPSGGINTAHTLIWISTFLNCEEKSVCPLSSLVCGTLFWQPS